MLTATPGSATTALLEGAPAGLTLTAHLRDGDEILPTIVTIVPLLDSEGDALDAYSASFIAPLMLPVTIVWLEGLTVVASEVISGVTAISFPVELTLAGFKRRLDRELTVDDDKLTDYLTAALMQAQAPWPLGCGRLLIPDPLSSEDPPVTRVVIVRRGRALVPDASSITSVVIGGTAITAGAGYRSWRKDGYIVQLRGLDFPDPYQPVAPADEAQCAITGHFGFQSLPANLTDAIYVLAGRYLYEEAVLYADQIEVLEGTAVQSYYRQLPVRTRMVFQSYAVPTGVVSLA